MCHGSARTSNTVEVRFHREDVELHHADEALSDHPVADLDQLDRAQQRAAVDERPGGRQCRESPDRLNRDRAPVTMELDAVAVRPDVGADREVQRVPGTQVESSQREVGRVADRGVDGQDEHRCRDRQLQRERRVGDSEDARRHGAETSPTQHLRRDSVLERLLGREDATTKGRRKWIHPATVQPEAASLVPRPAGCGQTPACGWRDSVEMRLSGRAKRAEINQIRGQVRR